MGSVADRGKLSFEAGGGYTGNGMHVAVFNGNIAETCCAVFVFYFFSGLQDGFFFICPPGLEDHHELASALQHVGKTDKFQLRFFPEEMKVLPGPYPTSRICW
jgi:hypothetical protein